MNSQDDDDGNNIEEASKSSLEPIIPLKVYLALPRKRFIGDTAYLRSDIAPRLSLSVTLSKKEEDHEAKPKSVKLNKENKEKLKKHCLESEFNLLNHGRLPKDIVELFNRCKNLKEEDITKEDFRALKKYYNTSAQFQGDNELLIILLYSKIILCIIDLLTSVHNFIEYEKRLQTNNNKTNARNKTKRKKMVLLNEKNETSDKLKTLTDEMNNMAAQCKTQLEEKDAQLKTLTDEMNDKAAQCKTQLEEKDTQLKTLTDEMNDMAAQCKTRLEENNVSDITKCKEQLHNLRKNTVESTKLMECSICSDIYKVPVMLPCGHAFCMGCCYMSMKVRYVLRASSFDSCMLCLKKFQFNDVKRLFNSFDLLTENLVEAKQKYCDDDNNILYMNEWKDEQKKGNDTWTKIQTVSETEILKEWDKLRRKEASEEYAEEYADMRNWIEERNQSLLQMWLENYPTDGFFTGPALPNPDAEITSDDDDAKSFDDDDPIQRQRDKIEYLVHRGIMPRHMLTVGSKSGTKDAIVERMTKLGYSAQDVDQAQAAFRKWKKHLYNEYDYDNPIFNDKPRNGDEQKCFDSFIFSEYKCQFNRQMKFPTRQSMYDLKKNLRRNWRLLGFEPHFYFFDEGEEAYCNNMNQQFFDNKIQPNRKNSEKKIPSEVPDSVDNQNKLRANNKRPHSEVVDRSYSGQRPNDNKVNTRSYGHNGGGNRSSSGQGPHYYNEGRTHSHSGANTWNKKTW